MDVRRDVDADELQLGAHVGTFELQRRVAGNVIGGNARHLVAWRDQTVDLAVPQRAFADRVDIRIGGATGVIDDDAAALADRKTGGARRSEEHTSDLQSLMRHSYAVFCL